MQSNARQKRFETFWKKVEVIGESRCVRNLHGHGVLQRWDNSSRNEFGHVDREQRLRLHRLAAGTALRLLLATFHANRHCNGQLHLQQDHQDGDKDGPD